MWVKILTNLNSERRDNISVLITGGTGYVGSHVNKFFMSKGIKTILLDNLTNSSIQSALRTGAKIYIGDYGNKKLLTEIFQEEDIDTIIHLGGYISVQESVSRPLKYYYNNAYKTHVLLQQAKQAGIKNIIFASSAAVYGKNDSMEALREEGPIDPSNAYGRSKFICEKMIEGSGMRYCNLRFFNIAGSDETVGESHKEEFHIIPILMECHLNRQTFHLNGDSFDTKDGTCIRDYVHIKDVVNIIYECYKYNYSTTLNVGSGVGASNLDLIKEFQDMGYDISYNVVGKKGADAPILISNIEKAKKLFNWTPEYSNLRNIIKDTVYWGVNRNY